ncbi:MAG: DNA-processing protein DprA [Candidatus Scalindua sp.]|nr:DNA-processing protein DprA [Candidatus Scalindua sp.]
MNLKFLGNQNLLDKHKTAFLCSRNCPSDIILKSLDWAKEKKDKGECVISGFHSQIEKDVFSILLKGTQPIILVLARGMKKRWSRDIKEAIESNRLLIISPFDESVKYITQKTANRRNEIMANLSNEIFLAYYTECGNLHNLVKSIKNKEIRVFKENKREQI